MLAYERAGRRLHYRVDGPEGGPAILLANSLGTDLRLWDPLLPHLPAGLRFIRYDKVGHGLSDGVADTPPAETTMVELVADAETLLDHLGVERVVVVGLSIGGLIAQGLATGLGGARRDRIAAAAMLCTGHKIGTRAMWDERIATTWSSGLETMADAIMTRWFSERFRAEDPSLTLWRNMVTRTSPGGYAACSAAIRDADFTEACATIAIPALCVAGTVDGATPPETLKALAALIPGAAYAEIDGAGHLPCVEAPARLAEILTPFLEAHTR